LRIEVRFFASLADATGQSSETLDLARSTDVEGLWAQLIERHPRLGQLGYRPLVACDMDYAAWDRLLDGVREVAFLPPVSGG
jgi:molybdopterin converting factor subunit 1